MTTKELAFKAPPALAVALGAVTPDPGVTGAVVWSTVTLSLLQWNGSSWVFPGSVVKSVTLDFGSIPVISKGFSFADALATTASKIIMTAAATSDDLEMDGFSCAAYCAVAGTVLAYVQALQGPVSGTRTFNYFLG